MERVITGAEEVCQNDSKHKCEDKTGRVSEMKSLEVNGVCRIQQNRNRAYLKSSPVEQDKYKLSLIFRMRKHT